MTESKEWLTPDEFAEATGGKAAPGTRLLVDGRPAVYCLHPAYGILVARWADEEGGYAVNLGLYEVLLHRSGIDATRQLQHEQEGNVSTYTPTTRQMEDFWASDGTEQPAAKSHDRAEGVAEFRRWLEQHDHETAARAWDKGYGDGYRDAQEYRDSGGWEGCGPDAHDCDCPNPYKEEARPADPATRHP